jgi:hypothetical protein
MLIKEEKNDLNKIIHYQALCTIFYENEDFKAFKKYNSIIRILSKQTNFIKGYGFYFVNKGKLNF